MADLNSLLPPASRRYLGNYTPSESPHSWRTPAVNLLIFATFILLCAGAVTLANHRAALRAWADKPLWIWQEKPEKREADTDEEDTVRVSARVTWTTSREDSTTVGGLTSRSWDAMLSANQRWIRFVIQGAPKGTRDRMKVRIYGLPGKDSK